MFRIYSKISSKLKINTVFSEIWIQNSCSTGQTNTGLVVGVYDNEDGSQDLTEAGERVNDQSNGNLKELVKKQRIPFGKAEVYSGLGLLGFNHIAVTSVGPKNPNKLNLFEQLNEEKENIRVGMAVGARRLQDEGANKISVDGVTVPESAAEGAILGTYQYKANVSTGDKYNPVIEVFDSTDATSWASGEINAEAQNWARYLSHAPPNLKKPSLLANEIMEKLCRFDIRVDLRNREWMALRKMTATLSLIKSSCEPPILVELSYCGDDPKAKPIVLVGKGNVFDSGGLFMKPYKGINEFRADMGGAAAIVGCMMGVARKRLPINVRAVVLLYETMPSPMGLKPGDVVKNKHGTHIRISNPDNDCRVVLSDVINFTEYYSPCLVIDVGTFTRSIAHSLGLVASGVFTATTALWNEIQRAGLETGDRVWRMPLWKYFKHLNEMSASVDMDNWSHPKGGDACQAAAFLQEFVPFEQHCCCPTFLPFIHIDCFNTALLSQTNEEIEPYYREGIKMGRPTRTLIQFLYQRACLLPKTKQAVKPAGKQTK